MRVKEKRMTFRLGSICSSLKMNAERFDPVGGLWVFLGS